MFNFKQKEQAAPQHPAMENAGPKSVQGYCQSALVGLEEELYHKLQRETRRVPDYLVCSEEQTKHMANCASNAGPLPDRDFEARVFSYPRARVYKLMTELGQTPQVLLPEDCSPNAETSERIFASMRTRDPLPQWHGPTLFEGPFPAESRLPKALDGHPDRVTLLNAQVQLVHSMTCPQSPLTAEELERINTSIPEWLETKVKCLLATKSRKEAYEIQVWLENGLWYDSCTNPWNLDPNRYNLQNVAACYIKSHHELKLDNFPTDLYVEEMQMKGLAMEFELLGAYSEYSQGNFVFWKLVQLMKREGQKPRPHTTSPYHAQTPEDFIEENKGTLLYLTGLCIVKAMKDAETLPNKFGPFSRLLTPLVTGSEQLNLQSELLEKINDFAIKIFDKCFMPSRGRGEQIAKIVVLLSQVTMAKAYTCLSWFTERHIKRDAMDLGMSTCLVSSNMRSVLPINLESRANTDLEAYEGFHMNMKQRVSIGQLLYKAVCFNTVKMTSRSRRIRPRGRYIAQVNEANPVEKAELFGIPQPFLDNLEAEGWQDLTHEELAPHWEFLDSVKGIVPCLGNPDEWPVMTQTTRPFFIDCKVILPSLNSISYCRGMCIWGDKLAQHQRSETSIKHDLIESWKEPLVLHQPSYVGLEELKVESPCDCPQRRETLHNIPAEFTRNLVQHTLEPGMPFYPPQTPGIPWEIRNLIGRFKLYKDTRLTDQILMHRADLGRLVLAVAPTELYYGFTRQLKALDHCNQDPWTKYGRTIKNTMKQMVKIHKSTFARRRQEKIRTAAEKQASAILEHVDQAEWIEDNYYAEYARVFDEIVVQLNALYKGKDKKLVRENKNHVKNTIERLSLRAHPKYRVYAKLETAANMQFLQAP